MEPIPNVKSIIESKDYDAYKEQNPDVKPFKYPQMMKRAWRKVLDEQVVPLDNELKWCIDENKSDTIFSVDFIFSNYILCIRKNCSIAEIEINYMEYKGV